MCVCVWGGGAEWLKSSKAVTIDIIIIIMSFYGTLNYYTYTCRSVHKHATKVATGKATIKKMYCT